jgi:hypothetical protein
MAGSGRQRMKRLEQLTLIVSFIAVCWLGMQAVHELGHVLAARATGGTIVRVVLYPTTISRTEVFPNPHPLVEVWAGPIVGSILPLLGYLIAAALRSPGLYLCRFFAGFCLVANGSYVLAGAFEQMGDPGELLRYGAHLWQLLLFGLLTTPLGFYLWNALGPKFGLGSANGQVSGKALAVISSITVLAVTIELIFGYP